MMTNDRAVSPVLGVALLIAITVVLAGIIGFVVLGVDTGEVNGPNAQLEFTQTGTGPQYTIDVTHTAGKVLRADNIRVVIDDNSGDASDTGSFDSDLRAGDSLTLTTDVESTDIIRIVYDDPNDDRSTVIAKYTVE